MADATHDVSPAGIKSCLLLLIEGGATVYGSVTVWDVIDF
jgi:hypothetical protein